MIKLRIFGLLAFIALASCGNMTVSDELELQFGQDKDVAKFVQCVIERYQSSIAECNIDPSKIDKKGRKTGISPTAWLAEKRYLTPATLAELIRKGVNLNDPNAPGGTTLGYIVEEYPIEYLKIILSSGFDVNSCQYIYNKDTCIIFSAIDSNDIEKLKLIVESGADIEKVDEFFGETSLLYSITTKNFDAAIYLLDRGAQTRAVTKGMDRDFCWHIENVVGLYDLTTKSEDAPSEESRVLWLGRVMRLKAAIERHHLKCGKIAGVY